MSNITKLEEIPVLMQVKILSKVRSIIFNDKRNMDGICMIVAREVEKELGYYISTTGRKQLFPMLTFENAEKFGAETPCGYWWGFSRIDNLQRCRFLSWVIHSLTLKLTLPLSPANQIVILKNIDWEGMKKNKEGICSGVEVSMNKLDICRLSLKPVHTAIPLITKRNAVLFGGFGDSYWWKTNKFGYWLRKRFINWVISVLEDEDCRCKSR